MADHERSSADPEGEPDLPRSCAPPAAEVMPLAGSAIRQPSAPPMMARKRRLDDERRQDADLRESERAQRTDLTRARGDECVHRVHRAEHGTDAHDDRHEHRQPEKLPRDDAGLVLVVLALLHRLHLHARIVLELGIERADRRRVTHAQRDRVITARLNAGPMTSTSPQISLSKPLPPASNTPTIFQSRRCSLNDRPISMPVDALEDLPADDDFVQARLGSSGRR